MAAYSIAGTKFADTIKVKEQVNEVSGNTVNITLTDKVDAWCIKFKVVLCICVKKSGISQILSASYIIIRRKKHTFTPCGCSIFYAKIPWPGLLLRHVLIHMTCYYELECIWINKNHQIFSEHLPGDRHSLISRMYKQIKESLDV